MHPAYSVILFTTASGAGYGLLIWLAFAALAGVVPLGTGFGLVAFSLALILITAGLLSSMLHLGRPERAWRAFSQWQTSWLSREGVSAVITYLPALLFALGWVVIGNVEGYWALCAIATIVLALITVWCTGMIYASLTTIKAWNHPLVAPMYCVLAVLTGGLCFVALSAFWFGVEDEVVWLLLVTLLTAWLMKVVYWSQIYTEAKTATAGDATGLARFGTVRVLEPPHTQSNFVMREMGYSVARKHAEKLRLVATGGLFVLPGLCLLLLLVVAPAVGVVVSLIMMAAMIVGVVTERWLFFAEAKHIVTLYYGAGAV
ncbi:MAG: dimethyl sulfoxide reductase anchor subunit family protein [Hyphomicrobiaceae bacterium]